MIEVEMLTEEQIKAVTEHLDEVCKILEVPTFTGVLEEATENFYKAAEEVAEEKNISKKEVMEIRTTLPNYFTSWYSKILATLMEQLHQEFSPESIKKSLSEVGAK